MSRISNVVVGAIGLTGLATAGVQDGHSAPNAANPSSVIVVNSASQPVPTAATGTTNISGTVGLASGATVGLAPGTTVALADNTSVGISGTPSVSVTSLPAVQVGNTGSSPVPANIVETRTPFCYGGSLAFWTGMYGSVGSGGYTPPDGYRLIIKQVSANIQLQGADHIRFVELMGQNGAPNCFMPATDQGFDGTNEWFNACQQVDIEVDPGQRVTFYVQRFGTTGTGNVDYSVTGYLEPVGG